MSVIESDESGEGNESYSILKIGKVKEKDNLEKLKKSEILKKILSQEGGKPKKFSENVEMFLGDLKKGNEVIGLGVKKNFVTGSWNNYHYILYYIDQVEDKVVLGLNEDNDVELALKNEILKICLKKKNTKIIKK